MPRRGVDLVEGSTDLRVGTVGRLILALNAAQRKLGPCALPTGHGAKPVEVLAAAFALGYCRPGGYDSGIVLAAFERGQGRAALNARSPFPRTTVMGATNGCVAYVPTAVEIAHGGYEVEGSTDYHMQLCLKPESEDVAVSESTGLLERMRE